jgi:hypothetical protein
MIQQSGQKPAREAVEDKIKMDDKQREWRQQWTSSLHERPKVYLATELLKKAAAWR